MKRFFNDGKDRNQVGLFLLFLGLLVLGVLVEYYWFDLWHNPGEPYRLVVYAFSTQEEVLTQGILPAFEKSWMAERGEAVEIEAVFGPSGTLSLQIASGSPADVAIFSTQRHIDWLKYSKCVNKDTDQVLIASSPMVIVTRTGNPDGLLEFPDLTRPGIRLLHGNPGSSGVGEWAMMAEYGSAYLETRNQSLAEAQVKDIWQNVRLVGASARTTLDIFELGAGDALVTYEQDAYLARQRGVPLEILLPQRTILARYYAVVVDKHIAPRERPVVEAFLAYLLSSEGQQILGQYYLRPAVYENELLPELILPFTEEQLENWPLAYTHLVEEYWKKQVEPAPELESLSSFLVIKEQNDSQ
ncbi:MAG: extracellular solute-binding protein [Anaerolineales bacterium]|nr:extracellular solute-binding protein [Anaerolineales bacterium]